MKITVTVNREFLHGGSTSVSAESEIHNIDMKAMELARLRVTVCGEANEIVKAEDVRYELEKDLPDQFVSKNNLRAILDCYGPDQSVPREDIIEALMKSEQASPGWDGESPVSRGLIVEGLRQKDSNGPGIELVMVNPYSNTGPANPEDEGEFE